MDTRDMILICKALSDTNRLEIVQMLSDGEKCGCKILDKFDITQPTLSHLRSDNVPINMTIVSMGCLNQSLVHPREMLKAAFLSNAVSIMMFHNHPTIRYDGFFWQEA